MVIKLPPADLSAAHRIAAEILAIGRAHRVDPNDMTAFNDVLVALAWAAAAAIRAAEPWGEAAFQAVLQSALDTLRAGKGRPD